MKIIKESKVSKTGLFILIVILGFNSFFITTTNQSSSNSLTIVVSLSIIGDWVENIVAGNINVVSIVTGLENPHTYDPTPSEIAAMVGADIFIRFGNPGLEPWIQSIIDANPNFKNKTLTLIDYVNGEYMDYDPLIKANNAHVWMSPIKVGDMCRKIYELVAKLDPLNNSTYYNHYLNYKNDLFELLIRIDKAKQTFRGVKVVVHHPSFIYFFDLLGIERLGSIEEHEGSEPSVTHIAELVQLINDEKAAGTRILLVNQPQLDEEDILGISESTGVDIVLLTPLLGVEIDPSLQPLFGNEIDNYIKMLDYNLYMLEHPIIRATATQSTDQGSYGFELTMLVLGLVISSRRKGKKSIVRTNPYRENFNKGK